MAERRARVERTTTETEIVVELNLDGGAVSCTTGVPFFDHMLDQLGRHGRLGLSISARGDLEIDAHHTVEDVGIVLGTALRDALGDKRGIRRYGDALVPMEESLARAALDISGRPFLSYEAEISSPAVGTFEVGLVEEFLRALTRAAGLTLHVHLLHGRDAHHQIEAIFKSVATALGRAIETDPRALDDVPSTKGTL